MIWSMKYIRFAYIEGLARYHGDITKRFVGYYVCMAQIFYGQPLSAFLEFSS